MFNLWKEDMAGEVVYFKKDGGVSYTKVSGAYIKLVYLYLKDMGETNPSYNKIAEETQISRSVVIRCVKVLEERGLIQKQTQEKEKPVVRDKKVICHNTNKYAVSDVHQEENQGGVSVTPKKPLEISLDISLDINYAKFEEVNIIWKKCFYTDIPRLAYKTLAKNFSHTFILEQLTLLRDYHKSIDSIQDPGGYIYRVLSRGGFQVVKKKKYPVASPRKQIKELDPMTLPVSVRKQLGLGEFSK